ncbi:MAG TPA: hypothetical protein PLD20_17930 [Blastocatellia bacterium]|nr:hypothetical protein [Blastocatellia bacterium]HMX26664.1 hypothetical protein [Blastocatellia bacterium]HMZ19820.1 hypothetical protein [Blastocatellia bacterium]
MNRYERVYAMKERVKSLPKKPGQRLFEFYRVLSATGNDELTVSAVERCHPLHQYVQATPAMLEAACATAYGAGGFVALEVGDSLEGWPLSFWAIRVLSAERRRAIQVSPGKDLLELCRKRNENQVLLPNYGCKDEAWFFQRGLEATWVAMKFLPQMPVPDCQKKRKAKRKRSGRPPDDTLEYVRRRRAEGASDKELPAELIAEGKVRNLDEAESKVKNSKRIVQIRNAKEKRKT